MADSPATTLGRDAATAALVHRREYNKSRVRLDNARLPAGSPMFYDCLTCDGEISVPEMWLTKPDLCVECAAMKKVGWLG